MRTRTASQNKKAATEAKAAEERTIREDRFRVQLGMSVLSDMFEHNKSCSFKECRAAGRCLAFDRGAGLCPMPLDTTRALTFAGMMWYDEALRAKLTGEGG